MAEEEAAAAAAEEAFDGHSNSARLAVTHDSSSECEQCAPIVLALAAQPGARYEACSIVPSVDGRIRRQSGSIGEDDDAGDPMEDTSASPCGDDGTRTDADAAAGCSRCGLSHTRGGKKGTTSAADVWMPCAPGS